MKLAGYIATSNDKFVTLGISTDPVGGLSFNLDFASGDFVLLANFVGYIRIAIDSYLKIQLIDN